MRGYGNTFSDYLPHPPPGPPTYLDTIHRTLPRSAPGAVRQLHHSARQEKLCPALHPQKRAKEDGKFCINAKQSIILSTCVPRDDRLDTGIIFQLRPTDDGHGEWGLSTPPIRPGAGERSNVIG